jgi:hypothetical protein
MRIHKLQSFCLPKKMTSAVGALGTYMIHVKGKEKVDNRKSLQDPAKPYGRIW